MKRLIFMPAALARSAIVLPSYLAWLAWGCSSRTRSRIEHAQAALDHLGPVLAHALGLLQVAPGEIVAADHLLQVLRVLDLLVGQGEDLLGLVLIVSASFAIAWSKSRVPWPPAPDRPPCGRARSAAWRRCACRCRWPVRRCRPFQFSSTADGAVVVGIGGRGAVDPEDPLENELLADAVVQVVQLLARAFCPDGWAKADPTSSSGVAAPGPMASCWARSLARPTNCSLLATGALSQRKSTKRPDARLSRSTRRSGRSTWNGPLVLLDFLAPDPQPFDRVLHVAIGFRAGPSCNPSWEGRSFPEAL